MKIEMFRVKGNQRVRGGGRGRARSYCTRTCQEE